MQRGNKKKVRSEKEMGVDGHRAIWYNSDYTRVLLILPRLPTRSRRVSEEHVIRVRFLVSAHYFPLAKSSPFILNRFCDYCNRYSWLGLYYGVSRQIRRPHSPRANP